jgi:hypothetical protein
LGTPQNVPNRSQHIAGSNSQSETTGDMAQPSTSTKSSTVRIVFSAFCFLLIACVLLFAISGIHTCRGLDLTEVSGFYGPGSSLAWLITTTASIGPYEWLSLWHMLPSAMIRKYTEGLDVGWRIHPRLNLNEPQYNRPAHLDGVVITAIAYPSIAAFDMLLRAFKYDFGASYEAAACLTQLASCLHVLASSRMHSKNK